VIRPVTSNWLCSCDIVTCVGAAYLDEVSHVADNVKKNGLFARIESASDAAKTVRDAAMGFFFVAVLQALVGMLVSRSMLGDAAILAILAGVLLKWRSRVAAVLLLLVATLQAGVTLLNRLGVLSQGGKNVILAVIMLIIAARAVEATFKLRGRYRGEFAGSS
jgi:hypothetical protein